MAVDYDQFKGKPFQVISKLGVRYTGIFDHISQEDQTICLAQVYNHGTEDRVTARKLAGSTKSLGWVRFRTESIESLSLVENYVTPGTMPEAQDPILASVSQAPPPDVTTAPASQSYTLPADLQLSQQSQPSSQSYALPPKPSQSAISAATALSRVERSLSKLSVESDPNKSSAQANRSKPHQQRDKTHRPQQTHKAPEVPDAEFDFQKANAKFQKEREAFKSSTSPSGEIEVGEPMVEPHPNAVIQSTPSADESGPGSNTGKKPAAPVYQKTSFFDNLSHSSSRVSRLEERHRNLDTFGETGGSVTIPSSGWTRGGNRGRGGRGRGENQDKRGGYNRGRGWWRGNTRAALPTNATNEES
ncbi:uncharacterized protein L203_101179 [Cryptococcus depauperatus CBS 7841]|uniref:Uncharacterized protein n=1 Tax=Cryptococcus depauperatus CBS 7841 TaxID=1295531 RepID=A0A1E3ILW9_9TREE|nr:hypothetical protein L203_02352 [Cryptococcus depauperatus CBS 7841]